jgi:hypothetical protein
MEISPALSGYGSKFFKQEPTALVYLPQILHDIWITHRLGYSSPPDTNTQICSQMGLWADRKPEI